MAQNQKWETFLFIPIPCPFFPIQAYPGISNFYRKGEVWNSFVVTSSSLQYFWNCSEELESFQSKKIYFQTSISSSTKYFLRMKPIYRSSNIGQKFLMASYFPKWVLDIESQNNRFKKNQEKAEGLLIKLGDFWWNELSFLCSWDGLSWKEPIEFLNVEPWLSVDSMPGAGLGFGMLKVFRYTCPWSSCIVQ